MKLPYIHNINLWSNILPIGVAIWRIRAVGRPMVILLAFFFLSTVSDLCAYWMAMHNIHNLWVLDLDDVIEFTLLTRFMFTVEAHARRNLIYGMIWGLFMAFWIIAKLTFEPFFGLSGYTHSLADVILSLCAIRLLVVRTLSAKEFAVIDYQFIALATILFYTSGSLFLYGYMHSVLRLANAGAIAIWQYNWYLGTMINLFFAVGLISTARARSGNP